VPTLPTLLLPTHIKVQFREAAVSHQRRRQGPSAVVTSMGALPETSVPTWPIQAPLVQTNPKFQCREAAVPLQCRRQRPSAADTDVIALHHRRQRPSPRRLLAWRCCCTRTERDSDARLSLRCSAAARAWAPSAPMAFFYTIGVSTQPVPSAPLQTYA
jgi:hypothetical protein